MTISKKPLTILIQGGEKKLLYLIVTCLPGVGGEDLWREGNLTKKKCDIFQVLSCIKSRH